MSLYRRAAKRDENEAAIVEVLRRRGFNVERVSAPGFPDLVVTKNYTAGTDARPLPRVWFVEVKTPKGKLTKAQKAFRQRWQGPEPWTLRTVDEALKFPEVRS